MIETEKHTPAGAMTSGKRRLLILLFCGSFAPSGPRRILDFRPVLARHGWTCFHLSQYQPFIRRTLMFLEHQPRSTRRILVRKALSLGQRLYGPLALYAALAAARFCDAVFIQGHPPPAWFTKRLKTVNPNIVLDVDDAVFLRYPGEIREIVRAGAVVSAGSHFTYEFFKSQGCKTVLAPLAVPLGEFEGVRREAAAHGPVRIGWGGSDWTLKYLTIMAEPLKELARRHPGRFVFVIAGVDARRGSLPDFGPVPVKTVSRVPIGRVPEIVASFDIGVMPLFGDDWDRGKCGGKALDCMAAGVPVVCSAVGENLHIIQDGVNGFLASTSSEWVEKLEKLICSSALRSQIGAAGQATVRARHSTEACSRILLEDVLGRFFQVSNSADRAKTDVR